MWRHRRRGATCLLGGLVIDRLPSFLPFPNSLITWLQVIHFLVSPSLDRVRIRGFPKRRKIWEKQRSFVKIFSFISRGKLNKNVWALNYFLRWSIVLFIAKVNPHCRMFNLWTNEYYDKKSFSSLMLKKILVVKSLGQFFLSVLLQGLINVFILVSLHPCTTQAGPLT